MRNMKFLATTLVAVMLACVLALASLAATTPFKDVDDKNEELSEAVSLLSGLGVAKGTSEDTFGTMELVTRQQMAAFVYRLMKKGESLEGGSNYTPFTDLDDSTYFSYVSWANTKGIIKGTSDTTFDPKGGITLQDAYTMLVRALGHEDESYTYPYSHIDKAEKLGLDEDIDSVVGYTTKLTRGDVAILLHNAFFAETASKDTSYVTKTYAGVNFKLDRKDEYLTLAEKVYDVEVGTFTVRATPKYAFNDSEASNEFIPLCDDFDKDVLQLVATEIEEPLQQLYCDFADTGLDGNVDDYIMRELEMFYTYKEENGSKKLDNVYFLRGNYNILETNDASYDEKDDDVKTNYYYENGSKTTYIKPEGYFKVGNEIIFFVDEDTPYSYLEPQYTAGMDEYDRQAANAAENCRIIDIKQLDSSKGTYSYYIDTQKPTSKTIEFEAAFVRVFSKGIYKLKFLDMDGNGIYEYVHYMPATYGFMNGDDDKYFSSEMTDNLPIYKTVNNKSNVDLDFIPTIYYNDADITGVEFKDGDMVVAYLNPAANIIDVQAVITPYRGYVSKLSGSATIKIDNQNFMGYHSYRAVEGLNDGANFGSYNDGRAVYKLKAFYHAQVFRSIADITNAALHDDVIGEAFDIYAIKTKYLGTNTILWYDHLEDASIAFEMDELAIPSSDVILQSGMIPFTSENILTKRQFDKDFGDEVHYIPVYFNGKVSYYPLDLDDMYPRVTEYTSDGVYNITAAYDLSVGSGTKAYADKICKVVVNSDGHYALVPLLHVVEDDNTTYAGINRDASTLVQDDNNDLFGFDLGSYSTPGYIKKVAGTRYQLVDASGVTLLGDPVTRTADDTATTIDYFDITDITRIVIKDIDTNTGDYEYLEFDKSNFKSSVVSMLSNIQYILKGNPNSKTRAELVLLYAEAADFEFETKTADEDWRILSSSEIVKDEDGNYRYQYKLFNPYTGEIEEDVPGEETSKKAATLSVNVVSGDLVEIKAGLVDDDVAGAGAKLDLSTNTGLVYITEYNENEGYMGFVPVEAVYNNEPSGQFTGETFVDYVESYVYDYSVNSFDGVPFKVTTEAAAGNLVPLYYEITEDTVITVLTTDKKDSKSFADATDFKLASIDVISNPSRENKCYNIRVLDKNGNYTTKYAKYLKAYVHAPKDAVVDGRLPEAEFIIIVVHGDEDMVFSNHDANFRNED